MTQPITWTDSQIETLARMWDAGKAGTEIGAAIGKNRSAVLGKIYRMYDAGYPFARERLKNVDRIAARRTVVQQPARHMKRAAPNTGGSSKVRAIRAGLRVARAESLTHPVDITGAKPWTERAFGECAFPVMGVGAETLSCCAKTPNETTYCIRHQAVMYVAPSKGAGDQPSFKTRAARRFAA